MADAATIRALQAVSDPVGQLWLLELGVVGSEEEPVRIAADTRNWVAFGHTWIGLPVRVKPPQDVAGETARASLEIDNIGREMVSTLELLPLGKPLRCVMRFVRRNAPDIAQFEYRIGMSRADATTPVLRFTLGDDDFLRRPAVMLRIDPTTRKGLFVGEVATL